MILFILFAALWGYYCYRLGYRHALNDVNECINAIREEEQP